MVKLRANAKKEFRDLMAHTPRIVRVYLTNKRIQKLTAHLMSRDDLLKCQKNSRIRDEIVEDYKKRFPKQSKRLAGLMNEQIQSCEKYSSLDSVSCDKVCRQMEYVWFAYGFYPDEYTIFELGGQSIELEKLQSFVSDTERWAFRYAANDFTFSLLADKAATYKKFHQYYKRDVVIVENKKDYDDFLKFIGKHGVFVQKLVSSSRGNGVSIIKKVDDPKAYFDSLLCYGKTMLEECIQQAGIMAELHEASVNTLRISTYNTRRGIHIGHGIVRAGRGGSSIDNAAKGGISATVDVKKGVICSDGYVKNGKRYSCHPDTGVQFKDFVLPEWDEATRICREIAVSMPMMKYLSFDLAYSVNGWVIVEINPSGGYHFQAGNGQGFKEDLRKLIMEMDLMVSFTLKE